MNRRPVTKTKTKRIRPPHISLIADSEMKQALQKLAEAEHRSLSQYLRIIVVEHLATKGVELNPEVLI